ncbi:MAG: aminotransferase class V-fold PLP-dependent enzyme [Clostridia bacterium]|nr:aminotransferase class V-fold PLP-dependent enzyme [Clostridia bacterium]
MDCFNSMVAGQDLEVPIINSKHIRYVNLDNAASTPPFKIVLDKINEFSGVYSNVHRGSGLKSYISTNVYQKAREIVASFVGADLNDKAVIFAKNTTEAINRLSNIFCFKDDDVVIASQMEHHSNDLPWRKKAVIKYVNITGNGELDIEHFNNLVNKHKGDLKLVTITGASNVTGYINPIHEIAKITHNAGAKLLVDASQLIPHREINIKSVNDIEHIDFIVFTAHKLYAPFGVGVLIGPRDFFNAAEPDHTGGGTAKIVTLDNVYWGDTPERNEAGTPNVIGAVALATAISFMQRLGMRNIEKHEVKLTQYLINCLKRLKNIKIYGETGDDYYKRLGVVSFNIENMPHGLVAAILSYEYGIGVRSGCFCAHPYVLKLLNIDKIGFEKYKNQVLNRDKSQVPGMVRVSLGLYNTIADIDRLLNALDNIVEGNYFGTYMLNRKDGSYAPKNCDFNECDFFTFGNETVREK